MTSELTRKLICAILACTLLVALTGCIGSFSLTDKIYTINQEISEEKWINELAFLGLLIVQIYSVTLFVDVVGINSIEFWTGENPLHETGGEGKLGVTPATE